MQVSLHTDTSTYVYTEEEVYHSYEDSLKALPFGEKHAMLKTEPQNTKP